MIVRHSILIVDDTTSFAQHLSDKLRLEGYESDFVAGIREALVHLKTKKDPTFILADRVLEDAIEVRDLERLCQHAPDSKVLVYTFQPLTDEERNKLIDKGAYRVLDKNAVDQLVRDIKVLTQELDELLELSDELQTATSERSKIMAALAGNDVTVSMVDRRFRRIFPDSNHEHMTGGICRKHCWAASFPDSGGPARCWGCTISDVFKTQRALDGLFLNAMPDGTTKWVAVRSTPVFSRTKDSIIAACEAVAEVSDNALSNLSLDQRLHHIVCSLVRAGFGRARIYKARSEESFVLVAAAARSDSPQSPKSDYFEEIRDLQVGFRDCKYAQRARQFQLGALVDKWDEDGPSVLAKSLGLQPPYFDIPIWHDDQMLDAWLAVDFVGLEGGIRQTAVAHYAKSDTISWLQTQYGREIKRAFETSGGKPAHRTKFEIAQRAHLGIASARSVSEATREIRIAFEKLLPQCRVSVRRRTGDSLKEFESLCWGPIADVPSTLSLSNQQSLAVAVVKSRFPIWIPRYSDYIQTAGQNGEPVGYPPHGTQSTAQIPLRFESTVFGTLSINSPIPIEWDEEGYKGPLLALADDIALVLRDLSLYEERDAAMADRAAIIAYSISVSADGLWRHWAQQRIAEASAIVATIDRLLMQQSDTKRDDLRELLTNLSTVLTRIHTAKPLDEAKAECSIPFVFSRLKHTYSGRAQMPSFHFEEDLPSLPIPIFILQNVLMILLDNSLEAIKHSGTGDEISVQVRYDGGNFLEILVRDNGPGIPPSKQNQILKEPLKSETGQGLGLLYARGAALQYGGDLSFKTSPQGTEFLLRLPVVSKRSVENAIVGS